MEEEILRLAGAPSTRPLVVELARRAPPDRLPGLSEEALDRGEVRAALNLALAAIVAGSVPPAGLIVRLLPTIENTQIAIRLLGSIGDGRLEALLDAAASGRNTPEHQALILLLAAATAEGREPPDELLRQLRYLARAELTPRARMLTGLAALEVADPHVLEIAGECVRMADDADGRRLRRDLLRRFRAPVAEALPDEAAVEKFAGFTIRKDAPRPGRNEPCPCGSGRKYKKCCLKDAPPVDVAPDPSAPMGNRARLHASMTDAQFESLHPLELLGVPPEELPTTRLLHTIDTLARYRLFTDVERLLRDLLARDDLPEGITPDSVRCGILVQAVTARDRDAVERTLATLEDPEEVPVAADVIQAILGKLPDVLERIEKHAEAGLRDPGEDPGKDPLVKLCASLLFFSPALGILVSRGCVDPRRHSDVERLLDAIEQARDALLLPPGDPALETFDLLSDQAVKEQLETSAVEENELLAAEAQQLRRAAAVARDREAAARRELARGEEEFARAKRALEASRDRAEEARRATGTSPEVVERLRLKLDEYKTRIAEGNEERRVLRRKLSGVRSRMTDAVGRAPDREPDDTADDLEVDDELGPERLHPRFPVFDREFREGATAAPDHVMREALVTAGALAGADPGAWATAKRIKVRSDLRSFRIGRHRLLFRLEGDDEIEFLRLIHRRDLEGTLRRMT